jgi:hypothetical protein
MELIDKFIAELSSQPWITAAGVEAIEAGLLTAYRDEDPDTWDQLCSVIKQRDLGWPEKLMGIGRIGHASASRLRQKAPAGARA